MMLITYLDHIINAELEKKFDLSANLILTNKNDDTYIEEIYAIHKIPMIPQMAIHNLEESAKYAFHLILKDKKADAERAIKIINTLLSLQVLDMKDLNYGIFPTYLEGIVTSHTDATRRIAHFFLGIVQHNSKYISKSLTERIETSIHAAFFFLLNNEKTVRHEGSIHYLSCASAYLDYGYYYKLDEYINIAFNMLNIYYNTIKFNGSFWEYNSKYDIYNTAILISYIKKYIKRDKDIDMLKELSTILWKSVSNNYHRSMNILTGPHSNSSEHIPDDVFYNFLERSIGTKKKSTSNPESVTPLKIPAQYQLIANSPDPNRFIRTEVSKGSNSHFFTLSHIASNYLQPNYTIGTFNREEMGRIHAPFKGYIKSDTDENHYEFKINVLNNNNPFSSAEFHSIQQKGFVLAHIFLNANRGNLHQSVDITTGKIITTDFRIRFEISGNIDNLDIDTTNQRLSITYHTVKLIYDISYIKFDDIPIYFESSKSNTNFCFDAVFDIPENYEFEFSKYEKAILQLSFLISSTDRKLPEVKNTFENGFLITETGYDNCNLKLESPQSPRTFEYSNTNSREFINGITLTHYVSLNNQKSKLYKNMTNYDINIFPGNGTDTFSYDIDKLAETPVDELLHSVKKILNAMLESNYNVDIFKRYSLQIISTVFEHFELDNILLKKNIDIRFFDIYQKISISTDNKRTSQLVVKTIEELVISFITMNKKIKENSTINKVIEIIDEKYLDPEFSLSMAAEMLDMNMSFISREFKKKTNTTYTKYLTSKRMETAKEMLTDGVPINEVIKKCGNQNVSNFKRAFKKYTGMTMSAWIAQKK